MTWNSLLFASICEGWFNCFIDWNQWITTLEAWSTSLWKSLRTCAVCVSSYWGYLGHCWGICRSYRGAILIYAFDCDWIWVSYKLFIWSEGHTSVWRNCVGSLTWNRLLFAAICEGWFNCFINWNQWIATLEAWSSCLWNTLRTCAGCVSAGWGYLSHCWGIGRSYWSAVLIYTFHCNWIWSTNILFFWRKGNRAIWIDAVFTYT